MAPNSGGEWGVLYRSGDPVEDDCVEFRLLYSGNQLVSDGDAKQKHIIRRKFHPQLKQLWASNPSLKDLATRYGVTGLQPNEYEELGQTGDLEAAARDRYFANIGNLYERGTFHFVPLIHKDNCLRVSIDILFLRRDRHPLIKQGGDIDNRLNTLFDAFRVPDTTSGLGGNPDGDEDPFFVLLHDDCLISEVRVNTYNLLMLPEQKAADAKDAFLVIDVRLKPTQRTQFSWVFE